MLIDVYEEVIKSPRLVDVQLWSFGDETELDKPGATPRSVWVPTDDELRSPDMLCDLPDILEGHRVRLGSIALRAAGCNVHWLESYGPDGHRRLEDLLRRFLLALRDVLESIGNYEVGRIKWYPRVSISQKTTEVVLPLRVFIPVWDEEPAALGTATRTNLRG